MHAAVARQPHPADKFMTVLPIAVLQAQMRSHANPRHAQQTRDAALTSRLAAYAQAVQQSQQLQTALQTVLAFHMSDTQAAAAAAAAGDDKAAAKPAAASNNEVLLAASEGTATAEPQQSLQAALSTLQAAEAEYLYHARSLQAECREVQQLLTTLQSRISSLSAKCQWTRKLAGDVRACSAALHAQLRHSRTAAVALAPVHQQQHTELLGQQQHARALQQLQDNTLKKIPEFQQLKLRIEKVQDDIDYLEYALKKASKRDPAKVPSLQSKLAAAEQQLAALQDQLTATQQLLGDGHLQAWYPELQQQLSELLLGEYGPAAAAGAIGGLAAAQLVMGQAGGGRLPCMADYRSVQVLHRTADRLVSKG
jgi:chromosome segregation ATPase